MSFSGVPYVVVVLATMLALFMTNRLRLDLVALMALLALVLPGVITTGEALAGFADPVVLMIAGLFVVGAGLFHTGVADALGRQVERFAGTGVRRLTAVIMLVTAFLSAFLSSTGTVAVMLPVVLAIARRRGISPSRLLMPLAFAALLGGMTTLIGTPPNLIVSGQLQQAGLEGFGFFAFTPPGLVMLAVGMACMLILSPRLVPERRQPGDVLEQPTSSDLFAAYGLEDHLVHLRVPAGSALASDDVTGSELRSRFGVTILSIGSHTRRGRVFRKAEPGSLIRGDDEIYAVGSDDAINAVVAEFGLERIGARPRLPDSVRLVDALVPPRSPFVGRTLRELKLRSGAGVSVLAQRHSGQGASPADLDRALQSGDALLLSGDPGAIDRAARSPANLVLLGQPDEASGLDPVRAPLAVGILVLMMLAMTLGWVSNVIAVLSAAVVLVLTRCVDAASAYRSINFESVVLIAAVLPMATALEKTGALDIASGQLLALTGQAGPLVLLATLFVFTAGLSQIVSNTATTVLVAPIAIQAATGLDINPHAVLMTVAIAASSAFLTPVASPVNALVLNPGGYRFTDFARVGLVLQAVLLAATLIVVPLFFPLGTSLGA